MLCPNECSIRILFGSAACELGVAKTNSRKPTRTTAATTREQGAGVMGGFCHNYEYMDFTRHSVRAQNMHSTYLANKGKNAGTMSTPGRSQCEGEMYGAAFATLPHGKAAAPEDREHRAILTQYVGLEASETLVAGERGQMSE